MGDDRQPPVVSARDVAGIDEAVAAPADGEEPCPSASNRVVSQFAGKQHEAGDFPS